MIPKEYGFKMPPEWSRHSRTLMAWPLEEAAWPGSFEEILADFARLVETVAAFEPVTLLAKSGFASQAAAYVGRGAEILELDHNDSWMRDSGPTFVVSEKGEVWGINWIFNAWGGKYPSEADNRVAKSVLKHLDMPVFDAPIVMEGGSFHVDGEGTLLTTEECLLNKSRNPGLSKEELEEKLKEYLGVEKVIWLKRGLYGDDTDGHVDNVACFARPGAVMLQTCPDPKDPNFAIARENLELLKQARDARGRSLEIIEIEQPHPCYHQGTRLTLSYINFYFVNGGIVLPVFGGESEERDLQAVNILTKTFPDRRIVPVKGLALARGGGNVHCLTQQIPSVSE